MNKLSHYILENTNQVNRNTDWLNQTKSSLSMKLCKVIIVFFLVLTASQSFAQRDEITTQAGEKIRCRILDETPNRFIYAYLSPTGKVLRNEIFKNLVSDFKYNIYPSDIVTKGNKLPEGIGEAREENSASTQRVDTRKSDSSKSKEEAKKSSKKNEIKAKPDENVAANESSSKKTEPSNDDDKKRKKSQEKKSTPQKEKVAEQKNEKKVKEAEMPLSTKKTDNEFSNYLKWRIGARGGFGNMLAKIPIENDYSLYKEKLLRGFTWGADAAYFFTDHIGLGMMFNNFKSQNKAENIDYNNEILNVVVKGNVTNKRSTKFVGPVLYYRKNIDFKTMVVLGVSPGVYFYNDKGTYDDASYTFKGMDFGASATLGIDFLLGNDITGRDIILSLETGYSYGKMRALDFGAGGGAINLATPIDLSRLDFTIGLRFTRYPRYFR